MAVREQTEQRAPQRTKTAATSSARQVSTPRTACQELPSTHNQTMNSTAINKAKASWPKGSLLAQRRGFAISAINTSLTNVKNTEDLRQEQMSGDDLDALFTLASYRTTPGSADSMAATASPLVLAELTLSLEAITELQDVSDTRP